MINEDCIFFDEREEATGLNHSRRTCSLNTDGRLCDFCRLWDAYIPRDSSPAEIEKAIAWQDMPYNEQPDYDEYFLII